MRHVRPDRRAGAARGTATTELAISMVVLIPVVLYGLYLADALLVGLRVQQVAIHEVWDSTGLRVHRYAGAGDDDAANADAYVNRVVQVADAVRDHTQLRYQRLNPFSPTEGVGTFAVMAPTLDPPSTPDPEQPLRPGQSSGAAVTHATMGARTRVEFFNYQMMTTFQPHLDPVFPMGGSPEGVQAELDAEGLLRRDYAIKGQAGITVRTTPLTQNRFQLLTEKKAMFDPENFRGPNGGPLELRLCAVGLANEGGRCTIANGFMVLIDDWAVGDGRPHMMTGTANDEYFSVVDRMYVDAARLDSTQTERVDETAIGWTEMLLGGINLPRPRAVLYFQAADTRRSLTTGSSSDNIYTTPNNPYVSGNRSGCYLGLPCLGN
ncbi:MAG TPA: hypothetical protein VF815_19245 [Myxococcaceae bacterium]